MRTQASWLGEIMARRGKRNKSMHYNRFSFCLFLKKTLPTLEVIKVRASILSGLLYRSKQHTQRKESKGCRPFISPWVWSETTSNSSIFTTASAHPTTFTTDTTNTKNTIIPATTTTYTIIPATTTTNTISRATTTTNTFSPATTITNTLSPATTTARTYTNTIAIPLVTWRLLIPTLTLLLLIPLWLLLCCS